MFPVRHRDWNRIRRRVTQLANPLPNALLVAWICVGIAATALLAWIPWIASYQQLSSDSQLRFAWVTPLMLSVGGAALVLAVIMFWINGRIGQVTQTGVAQLLEDLDDVYGPHQSG